MAGIQSWNREKLIGLLSSTRHKQGRLIGKMESLGFSLLSQRCYFGNNDLGSIKVQ
ncbi:MAG: DUF4172 domain-containing protein [Bacteroidetes bacterium]|nr:DUF4172 domain-containing protein [Bacteroidota bacterium]